MSAKNLYLYLLAASFIVAACAQEAPSATEVVPTRVASSTPVPTRTVRPSETPTEVPVCEGRRIAYVQESTEGTAIWVVCEDGTGRQQLVADFGYQYYYGYMRWVPNSNRILFWRRATEGITVESVELDGTRRSEDLFIPTSSMFESGFTLLPDGLVLREDWEDEDRGISLANLDGTEVRQLVEDGFGASLSPDGTRFAFRRDNPSDFLLNDLYTMSMDGTGEMKLVEGLQVYPTFWSPDGQMLAFGAVDPNDEDAYNMGRDLYVVASDGTQLRRLTRGMIINPYDLAWSPDSRLIAFSTEDFVTYEVDVSGDFDPWFLGLGRNPVWSPDGRKVAFQGWNSELNSWTLYLIDRRDYGYEQVLLAEHPNSNVWESVWEP